MRFGSPVGDGVGTGRRDKVPALREKRLYHFRGGVVRVGDQQRRSVNAERELDHHPVEQSAAVAVAEDRAFVDAAGRGSAKNPAPALTVRAAAWHE